ncbi:hypothetical protein BDZ89DRAFT_1161875 [Hymenopellis radicata]|nr:hypothetical protein BDZ89DRAFT_1161875 [Hymenopellis radicata]
MQLEAFNMSESRPNCRPRSFNFDAHSSPFHAQLGKCIAFDTPTPERHGILAYVRNIEPAVASCRDRVSRLTAVLADAQSQLDSLEELRRAHIKLFPPIHVLPAEVLLKIFELAVEKPYNYSFIKNSPWGLGPFGGK